MPPEVFQEYGKAIILAHRLKSDILRARGVSATSVVGECDLPSGANALMLGVTQVDGKAGEDRPLVISNGVVLVTAASAIGLGDPLQIADNLGRFRIAPVVGGGNGIALESPLAVAANSATLGGAAAFLVSVLSLAGGVTGPMKILPKGSAPAAGQCALDSGGTHVLFAGADAITSATVEYRSSDGLGLNNICGIALGSASQAGTLLPMLITRFRA